MQLDEQGVGTQERPTLVLSSGRTEDGGGWLGEHGVEDDLVSAETEWSRHGNSDTSVQHTFTCRRVASGAISGTELWCTTSGEQF